MDGRELELATHYQCEIFDGLRQAREAMLKLSRLRKSAGQPEIPKVLMRLFSRSIEQAGQVAKDYRV